MHYLQYRIDIYFSGTLRLHRRCFKKNTLKKKRFITPENVQQKQLNGLRLPAETKALWQTFAALLDIIPFSIVLDEQNKGEANFEHGKSNKYSTFCITLFHYSECLAKRSEILRENIFQSIITAQLFDLIYNQLKFERG